ncbi:MAG: tetratricopeptide repeat protein [Actinobacteria bacterium]|nr:tetratricopeptide repeat protein [Actinomycetota bacterium]
MKNKESMNNEIKRLKKAVENNPNDAGAHFDLGLAYVDKGMLNKGILKD